MKLLLARIAEQARRQPDRPALYQGNGCVGYQALWQQIRALAEQLQQQSIQRLALQLDNGLDWARVDLACALAGIVVIPVPGFFSAAQRDWLLHSSGADALIGPAAAGWQPASLADSALPLWRHTPARAPALPPGTAKITYTSGSTGQPKGVCLSLEQLTRTAQALATRTAPAHIERHLTLLPLATLLENLTGLYVPLLSGAASCLPGLAEVGFRGSSQLDSAQLARALHHWRPHSLVLVPELLRVLLSLCAQDPALSHSLRFVAVGGGKVPAELIHHARRLGLPVFEGYGLSECGSVVALNSPGRDQPGTVGQPLPHLQVRIAADGEICVRGGTMLGYLDGSRSAGAEFHTGDLGELDDAGFLRVTGRKKNVQITAFGRNFSPEWVEAEAQLCPAIGRLVIFGDGLAANVALIQPVPGQQHRLAEQVTDLNRRLPDYAQVHHWFVPEQPLTVASGLLTANGRPRRERIFQTYHSRIQQLAAGAHP